MPRQYPRCSSPRKHLDRIGSPPPTVCSPQWMSRVEYMTGFPLVIIAVLFCLNALDGFDALAISFAAPGLTHEWGTSPQALGVVISLGLLATGLGSLLVAPLADKF